MAAIETSPEPDAETSTPVLVGPPRNPDDCVLACPDCTCRRLLDERRGCEREEADTSGGTPESR